MTKSEHWILSEWRVAKDRCSQLGESLLSHRERTPFAEIDLLFEAGPVSKTFQTLPCFERKSYSRVLVLVEVKTVSGDLWGRDPLTARQRARLFRARLYLEARHQTPVRLVLAVVNVRVTGVANNFSIRYFEIPAGY